MWLSFVRYLSRELKINHKFRGILNARPQDGKNLRATLEEKLNLFTFQVITYNMPNKVKTIVDKRVVHEIARGMIAPGESDIWEEVAIPIPTLVPANLHIGGRLIRVDYTVEVLPCWSGSGSKDSTVLCRWCHGRESW